MAKAGNDLCHRFDEVPSRSSPVRREGLEPVNSSLPGTQPGLRSVCILVRRASLGHGPYGAGDSTKAT